MGWGRVALLALVAVGVLWVRSPRLPCRDFCSYFTAGRLALAGTPAAAFEAGQLRSAHKQAHAGALGVGPWLYSPVWLAPAALLATLPFETAERANRLLGAASLALALAFVLARIRSPALQAAVAAAFALAHPSWIQLPMGNWTFLLFALLAGALLAGERGRDGLAALAWAAAIHLKPFVALALAAVWISGRRRVVVRAAGLGVLLAALALPLTGVASWQRLAGFFGRAPAAGVTPYYNKLSLQATIARFQSAPRDWVRPRAPVATPAVRALFWLALPLGAAGLWRLRRAPEAALAFVFAFLLLAVPQIWDHTYILLFLALPALGSRHAAAVAALLALSVFYNGMQQPLLGQVLAGARPPFALQALLLYFPALALLTLATALAAGRRATVDD